MRNPEGAFSRAVRIPAFPKLPRLPAILSFDYLSVPFPLFPSTICLSLSLLAVQIVAETTSDGESVTFTMTPKAALLNWPGESFWENADSFVDPASSPTLSIPAGDAWSEVSGSVLMQRMSIDLISFSQGDYEIWKRTKSPL